MGSPFFSQLKKNATSFMHERYKDARLFLSDITEAELLAEKVTNNVPCSPDARTMTRIAEASYDINDYCRIADVLHRRLHGVDWKRWRQSYNSLILLEFLLTHGPEEFSIEFDDDVDVIEELGSFKHTDEKGIDWGLNMQKRSDRVLELLRGGEPLIKARLKALKITKEIQGFGNIFAVSSSSSSSSPSSAGSSFCILDSATSSSFGGSSSFAWSETDVQTEDDLSPWVEEETGKDSFTPSKSRARRGIDWRSNVVEDVDPTHSWNSSFVQDEEETCSLTQVEGEERKGKGKFSSSFIGGLCSKLGISPTRNGKRFGSMHV